MILATIANAKPNLRNPKVQFADGKIIGGQEAPKRKCFFRLLSKSLLVI